MFDREYLKKEMEKLDGLVTERLDFYLIGGGSMSFQNLKDATKDIDVVVRSEHDLNLLRDALVRMGYSVPAVRGPYKQLHASLIMENRDGFRWDIFVIVICGGLRLSDAMLCRAVELFRFDRVLVHMISLEDIFIFKSVTSRERDREDMYQLFSQGLDFTVIRDEIIWQNEQDRNVAWLAFFFNGVEEVVERYLVVIPFYDEFHDLAYSDMVSQMILDRLGKGDANAEELIKELGVEDMEVHLDKLVEKELAINNGGGTYSLNSGGLPS